MTTPNTTLTPTPKFKTSEYFSWTAMKQRCYNPKCEGYENYGGRGVRVCDRWMSFDNFLSDMGKKPSPKHSIDRIKNDGDYTPSNCKWSTMIEQQNNRSTNSLLTIGGITKNLTQWSEAAGIDRTSLIYRLNHGWTPEDAVSLPKSTKHYKTRKTNEQ